MLYLYNNYTLPILKSQSNQFVFFDINRSTAAPFVLLFSGKTRGKTRGRFSCQGKTRGRFSCQERQGDGSPVKTRGRFSCQKTRGRFSCLLFPLHTRQGDGSPVFYFLSTTPLLTPVNLLICRIESPSFFSIFIYLSRSFISKA